MSPSKRLYLILGALWLLALAAAFELLSFNDWLIVAAAVLAVVAMDGLFTIPKTRIRVERDLPGSMPVGQKRRIKLSLHNDGARSAHISVYDHHPATAISESLPLTLSLKPRHHATIEYRVEFTQRGDANFPYTQIIQDSPLRLWQRSHKTGDKQTTKIYPNFASVTQYALLAQDNRLSQIGILKKRRRGEGQDFHQLREYRKGDALRQVDWKATSRMRKLISREYQDERDQEIILLIDCGQRMRAKDGELSHFDHTLNATLLLAYVALRQGDGVGIATFGGTPRWLPPKKGQHHINTILNTLYDIEPSSDAPDYSQAALELLSHQKKRALVILVSNVRDEDSDDLTPALHLLQGKHLLLLASLKETALQDVLEKDIEDFDDAILYSATHLYLKLRNEAFQNIRAQGIRAVDVVPKELSTTLINQYLDIKNSALL